MKRKSQSTRVSEALARLESQAYAFESMMIEAKRHYTYWNDSRNRNDLVLDGFQGRLTAMSQRQDAVDKTLRELMEDFGSEEVAKVQDRRKKK